MTYCAIDFGTSNSAIGVPGGDGRVALVEVEAGQRTMPTAVFYAVEGPANEPPRTEFGRAAIAAYVDGIDGRLMRSMKSILGSSLVESTTAIGGGRSVRYLDVVTTYLRHLKRAAEAATGATIERAVLGRPVFFVDDDPARDAAAERALRGAAKRAGFAAIEFQYEPIAAAFDHEQALVAEGRAEERVLVCDIGGGTSDFSLVRVGAARAARPDRRDDILASHGVHVAGTDFDRRIELAAILPLAGYGAFGPAPGPGQPPREVPSGVYFDLATWHLVNTLYGPARLAELRGRKGLYADPALHRRLMAIVEKRLGHGLLGRAEAAKIAVADGGRTSIGLDAVEPGLAAALDEGQARDALEADLARIVEAARVTVAAAGLGAGDVDALYFTGGSTGLGALARRLEAAFPGARAVRGDRFASVATGLGIYASRRFGRAASS